MPESRRQGRDAARPARRDADRQAIVDPRTVRGPARTARQAPSQVTACAVTVDDGLVRSFVVTPPSGTQGLRELRAIAAARFAALYGESPSPGCLPPTGRRAAPFIACALPRELQRRSKRWPSAGLATPFGEPGTGPRLEPAAPAIPDDGWLLVGFGQTLTLVYHHPQRQPSPCAPVLRRSPSLAELDTLLEQERLRTPVDGGAPPVAVMDRSRRLVAGAATSRRPVLANPSLARADRSGQRLPGRRAAGAGRGRAMKALQLDFVGAPALAPAGGRRTRQLLIRLALASP
jgi:hypothetical protein